jgi:creatinine amidohydrolase
MGSMKWEDLTAGDFSKAVKKARRVCVLPLGCLEKHGDHLPVGTDLFQIRAVAEAAVAIEPAVIFPPYYLTQIQCAKHQPGAVALSGRLITDLLEGVCEEIGRNGFRKIILLNGHGGNESWLPYATWMMAHERQRSFTVYVARLGDFWEKTPNYAKLKQAKVDGHGGEKETSLMLAVRPDRVQMADIGKPGLPLGRVKHLPVYTPHWWYADFPDHYAGDGKHGTQEKGTALLADLATNVAAIIHAVKHDTVAPRLRDAFFKDVQLLGNPHE